MNLFLLVFSLRYRLGQPRQRQPWKPHMSQNRELEVLSYSNDTANRARLHRLR